MDNYAYKVLKNFTIHCLPTKNFGGLYQASLIVLLKRQIILILKVKGVFNYLF